MTGFDPKQVFSACVANYLKTRPGYPIQVIDTLVQVCGLSPDWSVADMGSGTGLLARLFLDFGCTVLGIEPNQEMRLAGEQVLAGYPGFTSLPGSAEATGVASGCIDLVSAGMAFHWFDPARARDEFHRILTPHGWVALVWNRMLTGPERFMQDYTGLILEYSPDWTETMRRDQPGSSLDMPGFFNGIYHRAAFPIHQVLDWDGLYGRTLSIAHVPPPDDPAHPLLYSCLQDLFDRYQNNHQVMIQYETELYCGHLE